MARQIPQEEVRVRSPLPTNSPFGWSILIFCRTSVLTAYVLLTHNKLSGLIDVPLKTSGYPTKFLFHSIPYKTCSLSSSLSIAT